MAEFPYLRNATVRKLDDMGGTGGSSPTDQPGADASKVCAYNKTRERFLSVDVESGDFSPAVLNARLPEITPGSSQALWVIPCRGISPTSVRVPIDLLYLNANGVVLYAVDSFPISQVPASSTPAASVVALPAQTIASTGTSRGDQLVLCPPEEMKRRLQAVAEARIESPAAGSNVSGQNPTPNRPGQKPTGNVLPWVDHSRPASTVENLPFEAAPVVKAVPTTSSPAIENLPVIEKPPAPEATAKQTAATEPVAEPGWQKRNKAPKGWLQKLLAPEPKDPRRAPREELSWLGAYFFTGGKPVAYGIRDISLGGAYVFTEERWYPGTVIRMTLIDRRQPTPDRSFTVNAKVVRAGNDGVGLQFVLNGDENTRRGDSSSIDSQVAGVDPEQVALFLQRVRHGGA
ncbi:MAG: PilZ domain-containing protein [Terracidiphilus sp.]